MRRRRKKASDLWKEREPVFGEKVTFKKAFPEIKSIRVEVEERGYTGRYDDEPFFRAYDESSLSEYIDCSNPLCYGGGFSIGRIIRDMVGEKKTHNETIEVCQGYEGSPKGRVEHRPCINSFNVVVDIEYYTEEEMTKIKEEKEG